MNSTISLRLFTAGALLLTFPLWGVSLGPFGGSASVVVADPHSPKTFLAGTRNGLLFRSRDAGESWTPIPFPAQLHATLNALAIDPQRPGIYLAGLSSELPQYSGILRSNDWGATWRQIPDLRNQQVRAIAFKWVDSLLIAVGTDTGVFATRDGGASWRRISPVENAQLYPIVAIAFDPKDTATIYAGTPHLPWKTIDGGVSWNSIHTGMLDDSDVFAIQVDRNRPQRVFASACSGIYRSLNGGAAWTHLVGAKDASYRTYTIVQDPQYENVWLAGTTHGIVRSVDGGATWQKIGPFATRSIAFDAGRLGRLLIATEDAGILRTDDSGKSWQQVNRGFSSQRLSSLWISGGAVFTSVFDRTGGGSLLQLSSNLSEWSAVTVASGIGSVPTAFVSPPWSPKLVLAKNEAGLFISEDQGRNWKTLELPVVAARIRTFYALDAPWLAAVGPDGMFLSRDGKTWVHRSRGLSEVFGVASTFGDGLVAATASGLKASNDLGVSWRAIRGDLEADTIQAIGRHPRRTAFLYAARYGVIFASTDAGDSWRRISPDPWPVISVKQLMVLPGMPDRLLVLTHHQGVWELPLDSSSPTSFAAR